jgi:hypothetical protein
LAGLFLVQMLILYFGTLPLHFGTFDTVLWDMRGRFIPYFGTFDTVLWDITPAKTLITKGNRAPKGFKGVY